MSNASQKAAVSGWQLFCSAEPAPDLEALNSALASRGLDPVSPRTYKHYRRLSANGFRDYLPINDLDMRLKQLRQAS
jgi:hypothetical protein